MLIERSAMADMREAKDLTTGWLGRLSMAIFRKYFFCVCDIN